jgi:hypothetical protein
MRLFMTTQGQQFLQMNYIFVALLASEQPVADAFATARLIPGKPAMHSFTVSTFNNTVPNS